MLSEGVTIPENVFNHRKYSVNDALEILGPYEIPNLNRVVAFSMLGCDDLPHKDATNYGEPIITFPLEDRAVTTALEIGLALHKGQYRKASKDPYIKHPLRLINHLSNQYRSQKEFGYIKEYISSRSYSLGRKGNYREPGARSRISYSLFSKRVLIAGLHDVIEASETDGRYSINRNDIYDLLVERRVNREEAWYIADSVDLLTPNVKPLSITRERWQKMKLDDFAKIVSTPDQNVRDIKVIDMLSVLEETLIDLVFQRRDSYLHGNGRELNGSFRFPIEDRMQVFRDRIMIMKQHDPMNPFIGRVLEKIADIEEFMHLVPVFQ